MSSAPTRAAAVCSTARPVQSPFVAPSLAASARIAAPSSRDKGALPDQDHRALGLGEDFAETLALRDLGQKLRPSAEILVIIGQVEGLADQRRSGNGRRASAGGCGR